MNETQNAEGIRVDITVPDWMVVNAFRYALGRRSYAVGETADEIRRLWPRLSDDTRRVILRDLDKHIELHRSGAANPFRDMDLDIWVNLQDHLRG